MIERLRHWKEKPFQCFSRLSVRENIKSRYKNRTLPSSPQETTISNADEQFLLKLNQVIEENLGGAAELITVHFRHHDVTDNNIRLKFSDFL